MRLNAFRIQNFRSIVDTGWNNVSSDNITGLIGQNESGKTSVLEALRSFYDNQISDEIIRSDLTFPIVTCCFDVEPALIDELFKSDQLVPGVIELLKKNKKIAISRVWSDVNNSTIKLGDDEILKLFNERFKSRQQQEQKAKTEIEKILKSVKKIEEELMVARDEVNKLNLKIEINKNKISQLKEEGKEGEKEKEKEINHLINENSRAEALGAKRQKSIEEKQSELNKLNEKVEYATECILAHEQQEEARGELDESYQELNEVQQLYENAGSQKEMKAIEMKLNMAKQQYIDNNTRYEKKALHSSTKLCSALKIFNGDLPEQAEEEAYKELQDEQEFLPADILAEKVFARVPAFEFFEDFRSLLPNRIDLEDITNNNHTVEGFKAAKNFLIISGLEPGFFLMQQNNRILKQKIEQLNGEITLSFQDYWRQKVGKNNKIKLHFELEHYDYNHPDKKGKPYLEFWIKDDNERLYPKQRSRGVRWFLSFYLELKAMAKKYQGKPRVLLIDEPGVSLHARAQEDVLKVFEDIKESIQIIYSTHSPHLIDSNKLYRLLAVQRAIEDNYASESLVFDAKKLTSASADTLSPIYTLMGARLSEQQFIQKRNNVIVEDIRYFYYLTTFFEMLGESEELFFLPSTGIKNMPILVNLMLGWKLDFVVLISGDQEAKKVYKELDGLFSMKEDKTEKDKILKLEGFNSIEDLFTTIDFKKHVLHRRVGITETNSEYIELHNLSPVELASNFMLHVANVNLKFEEFDEDTRKNIKELIGKIKKALRK